MNIFMIYLCWFCELLVVSDSKESYKSNKYTNHSDIVLWTESRDYLKRSNPKESTFQIQMIHDSSHSKEKTKNHTFIHYHCINTETNQASWHANNENCKIQAYSLVISDFRTPTLCIRTLCGGFSHIVGLKTPSCLTIQTVTYGGRSAFLFFSLSLQRLCLAPHSMCVFELTTFYHSTTGP